MPIPLAEFHIGRDPQCHLRPTNPVISSPTALIVRGEQFFVRDLGSANGTFVNDDRVQGERELVGGDLLKIGPLHVCIHIESSLGVDRQTPLPPSKGTKAAADDLEAVAAELLAAQDDSLPSQALAGIGADGNPGTTILMDAVALAAAAPGPVANGDLNKSQSKGSKAVPSGDTSTAAKALLDKYMKRKRRLTVSEDARHAPDPTHGRRPPIVVWITTSGKPIQDGYRGLVCHRISVVRHARTSRLRRRNRSRFRVTFTLRVKACDALVANSPQSRGR